MTSHLFTQRALKVLLPFLAPLGLLVLVVILFWPVQPMAGESSRQVYCRNTLQQIGLALHNYHQQCHQFPYPYTVDKDGRPLHSWRVTLLPFLENNDLAHKLKQDEPWDSPHNRSLVDSDRAWEKFHCPSDEKEDETTRYETSYVMVVDRHSGLRGSKNSHDIQTEDNSCDKIIVIEVCDSGIHWAEPRDLYLDEVSLHINDKHRKGIASNHVGGAFVLFGDGRVEFLNDSTDSKVLAKWLGLSDKKRAE